MQLGLTRLTPTPYIILPFELLLLCSLKPDLCNTYHLVLIKEMNGRLLSTFTLGPFKFPVMPFGLNNTLTVFQFYLTCFVYNISVRSSKNPSEQVLY